MSPVPEELKTQYELSHTTDISRKMQFGPEYVSMIGGSGNREKKQQYNIITSDERYRLDY